MRTLKLLQDLWQQETNAYLDSLGIKSCERCGISGVRLDISHGKKRRFLITRELYLFACRLCRKCHRWAEYGDGSEPATHERLERIHRELIAKREQIYRAELVTAKN